LHLLSDVEQDLFEIVISQHSAPVRRDIHN
jgi:hypothetical protein